MIRATVSITGVSPYSQSGFFKSKRDDRETWEDFEARCWREKAHEIDGTVFIPPAAFKWALEAAAQRRSDKISGKGKQTYTKHFKSGVLCVEPIMLGVKVEDMEPDWINANSDGKRGSGTRVRRCFPTARAWKGVVVFEIVDDTITRDVFERTLADAGAYIGVGMHRPQNGGYKGRFTAQVKKWETL